MLLNNFCVIFPLVDSSIWTMDVVTNNNNKITVIFLKYIFNIINAKVLIFITNLLCV